MSGSSGELSGKEIKKLKIMMEEKERQEKRNNIVIKGSWREDREEIDEKWVDNFFRKGNRHKG